MSNTVDSKPQSHSPASARHHALPIEEQGLRIARRWTRSGVEPLDEIIYELRDSVITNPDGSVVFEMRGAEIPEDWSQLATDIAVSKYFRKAGVKGDAKKGETSVKMLVHRIARTVREAGEAQGGYFATKEDADAFEAELSYLLVTQRAAFNSPVWFNLGLYQRYGIEGQGGNWAWDEKKDDVLETTNAYERPQCSACFIQSVGDDLMGIYELVKNEARLFKYGSGTGTNFSNLRGRQEKLSGGGTSSGLMSFLEVLDRAAGATKSGGTTRRAAKMVCLDMDHPEIVDFIEWKTREEKKARALIAAGYPADFNGDAYHTVSGQNSNNSIRVNDEFMRAVEQDGEWQTTMRTTGEVVDTYKARELWRKIADSAWQCADPGVQYDSTINAWHTCPNTDRINASNPCSEYMFLDDTACNLSSINLVKFLDENGKFDVEGYRHAIRIMFTSQEILVDHSSYPTKRIGKNSHDYRPLGLGYANLGTLLMRLGIPYDSDAGRAWCGALTAILTGHAYKTSAEMAASKGPFPGFMRNRQPMLRVMGKHRDMAYMIDEAEFPAIVGSGDTGVPDDLLGAAREDWDHAVELGTQYGYRNAQATVLAPTGTIGLLMDCDTTGIEPDFALVKFKKLAGGGYFKIVNQSVPDALRNLSYSPAQIADIIAYVSGTNTFTGAPYLTRSMLIEKGLTESELSKAEKALPGVFDASQALSPWVIGTSAFERLGIKPEQYNKPGFTLLEHFGLTRKQIEELNDVVIGRMTVEGAPHLRKEHYAVFDCANRCGKHGKRFIEPMAHVRMMAAAQPFLSGAISKTVNLPNEATIEEVERIYHEGWKLGLKAVALYRDGCKASQPLSTSSAEKDDKAEAKSEKIAAAPAAALVPQVVSEPAKPRTVENAKAPPISVRHRMSKRRRGFTQEAKVGGHKVFLRTGEYENGSLGEIFIDMHKEGAAFRSLMNCFAISVSMGLQHGVPLSAYVDQFTFTRFEPGGLVEGHPNIKFSTSIIDYVFRVLGVEYLQRYDFAQVPPAETQMELSNPTDADAVQKLPAGQIDSMAPPAITKAPQIELAFAGADHAAAKGGGSVLDQQLGEMMGDAPMCDQCGHITVRNGACYKCLNCGASLGCS
ncbi:vitamin B12-dependent ribonucleotide reductase [Sandaracinus amylolyticus]|uniref:Vitamin B12-dependent ribonucleotide reductase n=1 Tax=Sandaracinus amylolyticus TaxID=927083 RepID=A0A0F6W8Z7_9BACT|nr:vitamin B12-dependent ribonucleotide reductase [Sandaracinus amylolyticus]AKF10436.1 Ribonucleotide reductase of class II (coenzyme B12-dependent) [Sandaracinus amylolyticus]